ncbi:MAG: exosortase E/protease, VPEID-CTERM system [Roseovarius sp.]
MPTRAWWICGLFAAELVLIVLAFQVLASVECRETAIEAACRGLRGAVVRAMCLGALFAVYLWAAGAARAQFARMVEGRMGARGWALLHALAFTCVFIPLLLIDDAALNAAFATIFPLLAAGGTVAALAGLFWLAAPADWLDWLKARTGVLLVIALTAFLLPDIAELIGPLWYWNLLTEATFIAVALTLSLFAREVVVDIDRAVIGMNDFSVAIADSCSGVEGFALITAFMGIYAWLFRDTLRLGRYWLVMWPVALLMSWLLNVLRIVTLIAIGAYGSPDLAQNGFHSFAGWLFFILLSFGVLWAVNRIGWLSHDATRPAAPGRLGDDALAAHIAPFIVFMLSGVIVQAFWATPAMGYPLQVAMMAGALWWFRRPLARLMAWPDWVACGAGLVVGVGWVLAAPEAEPPAAALLALPPLAFLAWATLRILGTTLLVPAIEELFFRGYVLARLDTGSLAARALAIAVSSALFAALHGRWLEAGLAGLIFSLVYLRRGRVADAIAAHAVANALIAAVAASRGDWSLI